MSAIIREETIGPCRMILGDCLSVLQTFDTSSADIVMTSPPYNTMPATHKPSGLHADRKTGVNQWIAKASVGYFDQMPESEYQDWLRAVITECSRVANGLVWMNHKVRYRDGAAVHPVRMIDLPIWSEVVWDRGGSMALNCKKHAPSHEGLWAFGVPHWWDSEQNTLMSVWRISADRGTDDHPCAYPVEIARRPIMASCPPDGIVLEPFMGRGSTGIAAIKSGRRFIGIDNDERWFALSCQNLRRAWQDKQSEIKFDEPQKPVQLSLMGAE